jgi:hypothetical protein
MTLTQTERARLGGLAVVDKITPPLCPRCGCNMEGRSWHSYLGHLGLHGLADHHFASNIEAAQRHLRENGLARQDPYPENSAWPTYQPITQKGKEHHDSENV